MYVLMMIRYNTTASVPKLLRSPMVVYLVRRTGYVDSRALISCSASAMRSATGAQAPCRSPRRAPGGPPEAKALPYMREHYLKTK